MKNTGNPILSSSDILKSSQGSRLTLEDALSLLDLEKEPEIYPEGLFLKMTQDLVDENGKEYMMKNKEFLKAQLEYLETL